jgi:undecaprenyl-phosphate galactose phosphotransferase
MVFLIKRVFDFWAALFLLLFLSPIILLIALLLKICHPEVPVIFGVKALGKDRKEFREWKFSTMVLNADQRLEEFLASDPALRAEWEATHKLKCDPRIIPGIGRFLRRSSLNELPQLVNVLVGEMSLVGPRAITRKEETLYREHSGPEGLALRYTVLPGITGLWQVEGRSDISYAERVRYDRQYIENQSFWTDLVIIFRTALTVVRPKGAY